MNMISVLTKAVEMIRPVVLNLQTANILINIFCLVLHDC